jgi:hypothetical protein
MEAWKLLLGSDIGLASVATIAFCIVMGVYFIGYVKKMAAEDERKAKK